MSVLNPRNRLVNFRLSEEEFEKLKAASVRYGARSISEFARGAVLRCLEEAQEPVEVRQTRLSNLDQKVAELEGRVEQLLSLLFATGLDSREPAGAAAAACSFEAPSPNN
jgi:hypothetical protein